MSSSVNYVAAARRHFEDARFLQGDERLANAGQLFGFTMECGLKALLIACGVPPDADGSVPSKLREHLPKLLQLINDLELQDGRKAEGYLAKIPSRVHFSNWSVHHRYLGSDMPLDSLPAWQNAAQEMRDLLDQLRTDGVTR